MNDHSQFDVIIIGGSYSGLSAGMALGRALRKVLILDSGRPCNMSTPHSHNFITQDGSKPGDISSRAKKQVLEYDTVRFHHGLATKVSPTVDGFEIKTQDDSFQAKKLIFATGVRDIMPDIPGFSECWGKSIIHCPYCHGYEVKHQKTGIFANGDIAYHYAQLIINWTKDLTIYTDGPSTLSEEQTQTILKHNIIIEERKIASLQHTDGILSEVNFTDGGTLPVTALYARPESEQHCNLPIKLGCELTDQGLLKVDWLQKTTMENVFACGDNASLFRAVSHAVATGTIAGAALNNELTEEEFH